MKKENYGPMLTKESNEVPQHIDHANQFATQLSKLSVVEIREALQELNHTVQENLKMRASELAAKSGELREEHDETMELVNSL